MDYQTKVCNAIKIAYSAQYIYICDCFVQFKFIVEDGVALPVDPAFWDYLISTSQREWGLLVYEQDGFYVQYEKTKALQVCCVS